jgi:trimeric autotransporter adhesin
MTNHQDALRGVRTATPNPLWRRRIVFAGGLSALSLLASLLPGCGGGTPNQGDQPPASNPTPVVTSVTPATIVAGSPATNVTINGTGFVAASIAGFNGAALQTTFSSATQLAAVLPAGDLDNGALATITVSNPSPGGGVSSGARFTVNNPSPVVSSISPASVIAGAQQQTLDILGTGFVTTSVVQWNGSALQTSFVSGTEVKAVVPVQDVAAGQTTQISMANPAPGGGNSTNTAFNISSPTPLVTGISPQTAAAGAAIVITITGTGFEVNSVVEWNGSARPTTFVLPTKLQVSLSASDLQTPGNGKIIVSNPGPGGSATGPAQLTITGAAPAITGVTPPNTLVNTSPTLPLPITIQGTNFAPNATVSANNQALTIASQTATSIVTAIPQASLVQPGALSLVVTNPGASPSNAFVFDVIALPGINTITPNSAPIGNPDLTIQVTGSGLFPDSVVEWNGTPLATQPVYAPPTIGVGSSVLSGLQATIPAADLSMFVTASITVSSPEVAGVVSPPQIFPTYLPLPNNTMIYNPHDGMLYASVPGYAGPGLGNSVVAIDPNTGTITRNIPVGSEPNKLTISDDGTEMYVGLDGAAAVRQVNLSTGTAGLQFSLGGGTGIYDNPFTAAAVASLPGEPNSVAVLDSTATVGVFDSGTARTNTAMLDGYFNQNTGSLSFGPSAATLYATRFNDGGSNLAQLTIDSTGVSGTTYFPVPLYVFGSIQFDAGNLYLSNGAVLNATNGASLGAFYVTPTTLASGPIVSDSSLQKAWIITGTPTLNDINQVLAFNETTFVQSGSIIVNGTSTSGTGLNANGLVRWGQNGLAFNTPNQIYVLHSPVVKDLSQSPADLAVTIQAQGTAATGASVTYSITVTNHGPSTAQGVSLSATLADSISYQNATTPVGSCSGSSEVWCDLGTLANGATASIQVAGTMLSPGSIESTATVASSSYDPVSTNNTATATVTVSGTPYSVVPAVAGVAPNFILAGSSTTTLTVNGTGFTPASNVLWNATPLVTSYVSGTQLTASVDATQLATLGWAQISVSNPMPGGGQSGGAVVSIYQALNVPASSLLYDAFTRKLYATVPATATSIAGNSVVAIDPASGTIGTPVAVGNAPNVLAESADGNYLYIGVSGDKTLGQFNLLTQSLTATYPITAGGQNLPAFNLAVQPGTNTTLAIDTNSNGMGIFDITGGTGAFRPNFSQFYLDGPPAFANAALLYAESSSTSGEALIRDTVDANGLTTLDVTGLNGLGGTGFGFTLGQDGLVYGDNGGIINPATNPPSQVALLPLTPGAPGYNYSGDAEVPDTPQHKVFIVGVNLAGTFTSVLERFDTTNYINEGQVNLPIPAGSGEQAYQLVRWGQDGLAVLAYDPVQANPTDYQLLLIRGSFVLPAEAVMNPAPSLSSASSAVLVRNSGNQYLTAIGSGFIPGAVVLWNGTPRTTTFIDQNHLQFAVAAADVTAAQSVTLTSQNPGSLVSTSLTLTVQ